MNFLVVIFYLFLYLSIFVSLISLELHILYHIFLLMLSNFSKLSRYKTLILQIYITIKYLLFDFNTFKSRSDILSNLAFLSLYLGFFLDINQTYYLHPSCFKQESLHLSSIYCLIVISRFFQ